MVTETETCLEVADPKDSSPGESNGGSTLDSESAVNGAANHDLRANPSEVVETSLKVNEKRQSQEIVDSNPILEDKSNGFDRESSSSPLPPPHIDVPLINKSDPVLIDFSINGKSSGGEEESTAAAAAAAPPPPPPAAAPVESPKEDKPNSVKPSNITPADADGDDHVKINGLTREELNATDSSDPVKRAVEEQKEEIFESKDGDQHAKDGAKVESNGLHQEEEVKSDSGTSKDEANAANKTTSNPAESKKKFWTKVWPSKESQNKSDETDIEIIESPSNEKKNGSSGTSETTTTDVTIPICGDPEPAKFKPGEKELTPTHVLFRVKSSHYKYFYSFTFFALLLLLFALAALFLFPETFDIQYLNLLGEEAKKPEFEPIVSTKCGQLRGVLDEDVAVFRGIPYALPPIAENRWLPAKSPACDANATIDAFDLRDFCYQRPVEGFNLSFSEDCLYLNVWAPKWNERKTDQKPLPVLVYIAGDSLTGFTPIDIQWLPTGSEVVKRYNAVFLTLNYRTGPFGFLSLKPLTKRSDAANYGLTDLRMALKWIHENIAHFGGDASRVTVLSHGSAAALSLILATDQESSMYISRLWLASPTPTLARTNLRDTHDTNQPFITSIDCQPNVTDVNAMSRIDQEVMDCLLHSSAAAVVNATPEAWYRTYNDLPTADELPPTPIVAVDGAMVKENPYSLLGNSKIQIVIGANVEDTGAYSTKPSYVDDWESDDFIDKLKERLPFPEATVREQVMDYYVNRTSFSNNEQLYHTMVTDMRLLCPLLKSLEPVKASGSQVYLYVNEYKPSVPIRYSERHSHTKMTVHAIDVLALLDLLTNWFVINPKDNDDRFMTTMQAQFKRFIHEAETNQLDLEPLSSNTVNIVSEKGTLDLLPYPLARCSQAWSSDFRKFAKLN